MQNTSPPFIRSNTGFLYANDNIPFFCGGAALAIIFIHLLYFTVSSIYGDIYYLPKVWKQIRSSLTVLLIDCLPFFILQFFLMNYYLPFRFYVYYCSISLFFIIILRIFCNWLVAFSIKKFDRHINLLILGTNQRACAFYDFIGRGSLPRLFNITKVDKQFSHCRRNDQYAS